MGNFNPNLPSIAGVEWRPDKIRDYLLDSVNKGIAMRIKSGGAVTVSAIDYFVKDLIGTPGLGIEILDTLIPTDRQVSSYFLNTSGSFNNWENSDNTSPPSPTFVDDIGDTSNYWRNDAARIGVPASYVYGRGNATALSGRRIEKIAVKAIARATIDSNLHTAVFWNPFGGISPIGLKTVPGDSLWRTYDIWEGSESQYLNLFDIPAHPWSMADVNNFITTAGVNGWGLWSSYLPAANGLQVASLWMEVTHVAENRKGSYYNDTLPVTGPPKWNEVTLASTSAMVANTWYWLHIFNLRRAGSDRWWSVPILGADEPAVLEATAASQTTSEHRKLYETAITPSGVISVLTAERYGEMIPYLLDRSGTIEAQSQPYASLIKRSTDANGTGGQIGFEFNAATQPNFGQQITTGAATLYDGISIAVGWEDPAQRPDAPLTLTVRTGVGAITGGGTLVGSAQLQPTAFDDGAIRDVFVKFAAGVLNLGLNTQYHVHVSSTATNGKGWRVPFVDTWSDNIFGAAPTLAEIEGTGFNGTTDSLFVNGAAITRIELPMAFVQLPTAPAGLAASVVAEVCESNEQERDGHVRGTPAYVRLTWTATVLGANFGAYRVYRRPRRSPLAAWELLAELDVPTGYDAAVTESLHVAFDDYAVGRSVGGGQWADGWDYTVTVVNGTTGAESNYATAVTGVQVTPGMDARWWIVCNEAPYLQSLIPSAREVRGGDEQVLRRYKVAGRDLLVTRTPLELPARSYELTLDDYSTALEDGLRGLRAAAASGRVVSLVGPRGQLVHGVLEAPSSFQHYSGAYRVDAQVSLTETLRAADPANYNLPGGLAVNGTSQRVTVPDTGNVLDPASSPFTTFVFGALGAIAANAWALAKFSGGDGYGIQRDGANNLRFYVDGASAAGGPTEALANWTGQRVAIGTSSGSAQVLYRDGVAVANAAVTHGAIANADVLSIGAASGGTSWGAMNPVIAWGFYARALSAAEALQLARYLLGWPGYRAPVGAVLFMDLRDDRCWTPTAAATTVNDLGTSGLQGTIVGGTGVKGLTWGLDELERF